MTPRTSTGETPYSLVYGSEAVIPAEVGVHSIRMEAFNPVTNSKEILTILDLLEEKRNQTRIQEAKYKATMAKCYNKRVRNTQFWIGDWVLRSNDASRAEKIGKLEARCEGPYQVIEVLPKGAYKLAYPNGESVPRT